MQAQDNEKLLVFPLRLYLSLEVVWKKMLELKLSFSGENKTFS
jgi:hypothetical protein